MFLTGSLRGAEISGPDPQQERDPPPAATPITFPEHEIRGEQTWTLETSPPHFRLLFAKILKPTDITDEHARALNVTVEPPCSVDELVPRSPDGSSYLPSLTSEEMNMDDSHPETSTSDPAAARKQKDLQERLSELRLENDLAFRALNRNIPKGVQPPRLAYMRKFWEGLEAMSQYWDSSLDQYYETVGTLDQDEEKSAKRQRLETESTNTNTANDQTSSVVDRTWSLSDDKSDENALGDERSDTTFEHIRPPSNDYEHAPGDDDRKTRSTSATPEPRSTIRYKGRRTATGRDMPDQFRADMVKGFVEGTIWPFRTTLANPRLMPIVQFGKLNLPVRQTAAVYRMPNERTKARQGWLEGPILTVQARPETDFRDKDDRPIESMSRLDIMREIGGMLQLAQERLREGKTETKPGEGKWWATKPRWGGGPGGEPQNESGNSDVVTAGEELSEESKENNGKKDKNTAKERRTKALAKLWKEIKPGRGYWDPKTEYKAIGTDPESDYDDVFLVSSLNHHVSILRMTIHRAYLDFVTSNTMPQLLPEDADWCCPKVQRSQWFDLFDVNERQEAFRGLWGVMGYLTRQPKESQDAVDTGAK